MKCSRCQHENPADSRFCFECGSRLALACGSCGAELPAAVKFCNRCGQAVGPPAAGSRSGSPESYTPKHLAEKILTSKAALEGERKLVTVLFADLKDSMELLAERDPESRPGPPHDGGRPSL
jgi:Double zinc ribbon